MYAWLRFFGYCDRIHRPLNVYKPTSMNDGTSLLFIIRSLPPHQRFCRPSDKTWHKTRTRRRVALSVAGLCPLFPSCR